MLPEEFCVHLKVTAVLFLPARLHGQLLPDVFPRVLAGAIILQGLGPVRDLDELLHDVGDVLRHVAPDEDLLGEGDAGLVGRLGPVTW